MACVIDNQCAFFYTLPDGIVHFGTALAAGCAHLFISVEINLVDVQEFIRGVESLCHIIRLRKMHIAVAVIGNKTNLIAPVGHVGNDACTLCTIVS
ncbi:hypothetical protein DSECCO2_464420 [anaerobic digester metagenome]